MELSDDESIDEVEELDEGDESEEEEEVDDDDDDEQSELASETSEPLTETAADAADAAEGAATLPASIAPRKPPKSWKKYELKCASVAKTLFEKMTPSEMDKALNGTGLTKDIFKGVVSVNVYSHAEGDIPADLILKLAPMASRSNLRAWVRQTIWDSEVNLANHEVVGKCLSEWGLDIILELRTKDGRTLLIPIQVKLAMDDLSHFPNLTSWMHFLLVLAHRKANNHAGCGWSGYAMLMTNHKIPPSVQGVQHQGCLNYGIYRTEYDEDVVPPPPLTLRPWQAKAIELVEAHNAEHHVSTLQSATGTGKTLVMSRLTESAVHSESTRGVLLITPKRNLALEMKAKFQNISAIRKTGGVHLLSSDEYVKPVHLRPFCLDDDESVEEYHDRIGDSKYVAISTSMTARNELLDALTDPKLVLFLASLVVVVDEVHEQIHLVGDLMAALRPHGTRFIFLTATMPETRLIHDGTRLGVDEPGDPYLNRAQHFHDGKPRPIKATNNGVLSTEQIIYDHQVVGAGLTYEEALVEGIVAPVNFVVVANEHATALLDTSGEDAKVEAVLNFTCLPPKDGVHRPKRLLVMTDRVRAAHNLAAKLVEAAKARGIHIQVDTVTSGVDAKSDLPKIKGTTRRQRERVETALQTGKISAPGADDHGPEAPYARILVSARIYRAGADLPAVDGVCISVTSNSSGIDVRQQIGRGVRLPLPANVLLMGEAEHVERILGIVKSHYPTALADVNVTASTVEAQVHLRIDRVMDAHEKARVAKGDKGAGGKEVVSAEDAAFSAKVRGLGLKMGALQATTVLTATKRAEDARQTLLHPSELVGDANLGTFVRHVDKCVAKKKLVTDKNDDRQLYEWHKDHRNQLIAQHEGTAEWLPPDIFAAQLRRLETVGLVGMYFRKVQELVKYTEAEMTAKLVRLVYTNGECKMPKKVGDDSTDYDFVYNSATRVLAYLETQDNLEVAHAAVRVWLRAYVEAKAAKVKALSVDEVALVIKELLVNDDPSRNQARPSDKIEWTIVPNADDVPAVVDAANLVFHVPGFTRRVTTKFGLWLSERRKRMPSGKILVALKTGCLAPYFYQVGTSFDFKPELGVKMSAKSEATTAGKKRVAAGGAPKRPNKAKKAKVASSIDAA
jgi:superfamily II DNA or RNA helicase